VAEVGWLTTNAMLWGLIATAGSPAIVLVPVAVRHYWRARLLSTRGIRAAGRVLELVSSSNDLGGVSNLARVEYTPAGGELRTATVRVQSRFGDDRVGQRVNVTYVPARSIVRLDSTRP
jgi:hypothetical protein